MANEVVDTRVSESDPAMGIIHETITVTNGDGEVVLTFENYEGVERRGSTPD